MPAKKPPPGKWVATVGLTLKNGKRVEPGEPYPGNPPKWLKDQGKVTTEVAASFLCLYR